MNHGDFKLCISVWHETLLKRLLIPQNIHIIWPDYMPNFYLREFRIRKIGLPYYKGRKKKRRRKREIKKEREGPEREHGR